MKDHADDPSNLLVPSIFGMLEEILDHPQMHMLIILGMELLDTHHPSLIAIMSGKKVAQARGSAKKTVGSSGRKNRNSSCVVDRSNKCMWSLWKQY